MIIIGIDYGQRRTGVAISDPMGMLASPVSVIEAEGRRKLIAQLCDIATQRRAEQFVLGLPLRTDGTKGDKALVCEALAEQLRTQSSLPVVLWDERFSSVQAHQALGAAGKRAKNRKSIIDAVAAVFILQSYLDSKR